ncbi:MAG: TetR/AcrR family transcriptional regulator [bacterium]
MTAPAMAIPGRLERRKARTRAAIIAAASKLFHENGFEETSIQHIAELADTGVGTLYGYFESKDDILREVLQTERDEALEQYFAGIDEKTPYMERACMAVNSLAMYLRKNRTILVAAFQVGARNRQVDQSQVTWLHEGFREMIESGITAGEFRALPLDATVRMLVGTTMLAMLGIGNWAGEEDKPTTVAELEALTRGVLGR